MKKLLCVVLSVVMAFSCCAVFASAADGYAAINNISTYSDYNGLMAQKNTLVYGYSVDDLYNGTGPVDWSMLDVSYVADGQNVRLDKGSFALAKADVNSYLKRILNHLFAGERMFTEYYATKLTNFVGNIINPDYVNKEVKFPSSENPNEDDFFEIVSDESGLSALIQANWCDRGVNFKSFLNVFGVAVEGIPDNRFEKGYAMGTVILKSAVRKFLEDGPVNFVFDLLQKFSRSLNEKDFSRAVNALMSYKMNSYGIDAEQMKTVEGVYYAALGNIFDYRLINFPTSRVAAAADMTELQLFLLMYFAINYKYVNAAEGVNNTAIIDGLSAKFNKFNFDGVYNNSELQVIRAYVAKFIDCGLKGNITFDSLTSINSLNKENMDQIDDDIWLSIKNSFTKILRKIADYFNYLIKLFSGEIKFGENLLK